MKHAIRSLLHSPGHTVVALLTLAIGIGINTSMVSALQTLLFRSAPYPEPERIARIVAVTPQGRMDEFSFLELKDLQTQATALSNLTIVSRAYVALSEAGRPTTRVGGAMADAGVFALLGAKPLLGRAFTAEETQPGRSHVIVISHRLWQQRYGGDPGILGRVVRVDGQPLEIIGVMPPSFDYRPLWSYTDFWRPLNFTAEQQEWRDYRVFALYGRLQPDATFARAATELSPLATRQAQEHPSIYAGLRYQVISLQEATTDRQVRTIAWLLFGLSVFVLLIACANLANLQLARLTTRARELAVRSALGASRGELIGHQLRECVVLALAGGALGLLVAAGLNRLIGTRLLGGDTVIALEPLTLAISLGVSFATGILFGIVPAWLASRTDVNAVLKQQARGSSSGRGQTRLRSLLIVAEVALALVLLGGAGILQRGLARMLDRPAGWDTARVLTASLPVPAAKIDTDPKRAAYFLELEQRLAALPGVEHAAIATSLPVQGYNADRQVLRDDQAPGSAAQFPTASHTMVTPDFFATLGIGLVEGHLFAADIRANGPRVVVINASLARALWPGRSAIGRRLGSMDSGKPYWSEVIGVVRDVESVANLQPAATPFVVYKPLVHEPWGWVYLVLRSAHPEALVEPLRRTVEELDPEMPTYGITTVPNAVLTAQRNLRIAAQLLGAFALVGLGLAAVGVYGVTAHLVAQRTGEFGIRLALGAQPGDLVRLVLRHGLTLAAVGVTLGLVGATAVGQLLGSFAPKAAGIDWVALTTVAGVLLAVVLLACLVPARRALAVDPLEALRTE